MSSRTAATPAREGQRGLRADAMGVPGLALTVAATVGIVPAFLGASPLVFIMSGPGAPGVYALATAAYLVFAGGYLAMSRRFGSASGFIGFIANGFGTRAGVAAAYVSLLTFPLFLGALYGIFSMFFQQLVADVVGVTIHWAPIALVAIVVTTLISYSRIEVSIRLLGVMLAAGVAVVLVMAGVVLVGAGTSGTMTVVSFGPQAVFGPAIGLAMLFALGSYGGVESTAVYSEEVRDRRKTVSRGLYVAIFTIGGFYVLSTWAVTVGVGADTVGAVAAENPTGFIFALAGAQLGTAWMLILNVIVVVSFHGVLVGFTNISARYMFALGRSGLLPSRLGTSHPRHQSPHVAVLLTGAVVLVIVAVFAVAGAHPFEHLYTWLIAVATIGSLTLIVASSAATFAYHYRESHSERAWNAYIAPALSTVVFGAAIWLALANFSLLAGDAPIAQWLWLLVPIAGVAGLTMGASKRHRGLRFDGLG